MSITEENLSGGAQCCPVIVLALSLEVVFLLCRKSLKFRLLKWLEFVCQGV